MPYVEMFGPRFYGIPEGLNRLHNYLLSKFSGTTSGGMYNPASRLTSGAPSAHSVTQALDIMCNEGTGKSLMKWVVANAESLNLQQAICWHQIVTAERWNEGVRNYASNDHSGGSGHLHLHIGWSAALHWTNLTTPTIAPLPIVIVEESTVAVATFAYSDGVHAVWITPAGKLAHEYPAGVENLGPDDGTKLTQFSGVAVTVVGSEIQIRVKALDGRLIRWAYSPGRGWGISADSVPA